MLNGEHFIVNPHEGSFLFITDYERFVIPKDVVVIGVENMENFRQIRKQRSFFEDYLKLHGLPEKIVFVSRYPQSLDLRKWLVSIPNYYVHFGDFDLAGIHIFLSEFQKYLGKERSSLLIPLGIEHRLKLGSRKRYDDQSSHFKGLCSDSNDIQQLIELIHRERKGYDQEGFIKDILTDGDIGSCR